MTILLGTLLVAQWTYFAFVFHSIVQKPTSVEMMVVYSGSIDLATAWREACDLKADSFLTSGVEWPRAYVKKTTGYGHNFPKLLVEDRAYTTDQNARYSAPLIRNSRAKHVVLFENWFHLPRSLFLTRFYLWGSGIRVEPVAIDDLPPHWWMNKYFWPEMLKFWGSLFRVGLADFGIENWPPHLTAHGFEKIKKIN